MIYRVLFLNFKEIKVLPKTHWEHIHENERTPRGPFSPLNVHKSDPT